MTQPSSSYGGGGGCAKSFLLSISSPSKAGRESSPLFFILYIFFIILYYYYYYYCVTHLCDAANESTRDGSLDFPGGEGGRCVFRNLLCLIKRGRRRRRRRTEQHKHHSGRSSKVRVGLGISSREEVWLRDDEVQNDVSDIVFVCAFFLHVDGCSLCLSTH